MIRIDAQTDQDLRDKFTGWLEGEMQGQSAMSGLIAFAELGTVCQRGDRTARISTRASNAARRDLAISRRLDGCTRAHRGLLRAAFGLVTEEERRLLGAFEFATPRDDARTRGYEGFCHVVPVAPAVQAIYAAHTHEPFEPRQGGALLAWLRTAAVDSGAQVPRRTKGPALREALVRREGALGLVRQVTAAAERELAEAIVAYGGRCLVNNRRVPIHASMRQLARALGIGDHAVKRQLGERGLTPEAAGRGETQLVQIAELAMRWPEAAVALAREDPYPSFPPHSAKR